jgi:hypothetical protein
MATLSARELERPEEMKILPFGVKCARSVTPQASDKDKNKEKTATQSPVWTTDGQHEDSGQMDWYADTD